MSNNGQPGNLPDHLLKCINLPFEGLAPIKQQTPDVTDIPATEKPKKPVLGFKGTGLNLK